MSTLKLSILLFLCVIVSACAQLKPFEDRRREPGTEYVYVGASTPQAPVICYNPLWHENEQVDSLADSICKQKNNAMHAELVNKEYFNCRLFIPARAYYKCVADE